MDYLVKRDGRIVPFDSKKIEVAIGMAINDENSKGLENEEIISSVMPTILYEITTQYQNSVNVEDVQDIIVSNLASLGFEELSKDFSDYRNQRSKIREKKTGLMNVIGKIATEDSLNNNIKRENGNINGDTAMGTMLKFGSTTSKEYYLSNVIDPKHAQEHIDGSIHIHDLDFYGLTTTCTQIDIKKLLDNGFSTGHGHLRTPSNIKTASALACIAIQSNQNDQHGGQSIPMFDYGLASYVSKSFINNCLYYIDMHDCNVDGKMKLIKDELLRYISDGTSILSESGLKFTETVISENIDSKYICASSCVSTAIRYTDKETYQAMEALIHNLCTMNSRAGAQVPFSSINFGTDTSAEGRMVSKNLLLAQDAGLGNGETPIFPITIFKVKEGVNYNQEDPNYDLFKLACKVSAKRLFPNFSFIDAPFNLQYYQEGDPNTEIAYMGCRTRVIGNTYDPSREIVTGRGNLSFTSINLPRIAIESKKNINVFFRLLDSKLKIVSAQLMDRFALQCDKKIKNYPFLMGQGVWIDSDKLNMDDDLTEVLSHGTLSIGFIGLAETLKYLTGKHHAESESSQKLGLKIIKYMRDFCDQECLDYNLNYSLLATPAEGLSGRFVNMDRKKYGVIKGVTDRDYYTNSFHVPVYYPISIKDKLDKEAPYHALTNAGHISYVELDGDPSENLEAFEKIIRYMKEVGIGYGSINHPVDRDPVCGYIGIIGDTCPNCGRHDGEALTPEVYRDLLSKNKIPKKDCFLNVEE